MLYYYIRRKAKIIFNNKTYDVSYLGYDGFHNEYEIEVTDENTGINLDEGSSTYESIVCEFNENYIYPVILAQKLTGNNDPYSY